MRIKIWKIKTKFEFNFYELTKIQILIQKFEGDSSFKFLKNAKNVTFIFQKINFLNFNFCTRIKFFFYFSFGKRKNQIYLT